MSEELNAIPIIDYLSDEEKKFTRVVYEKVFWEDTKSFIDFYYEYKTRDNEILVLREDNQIVSMLHLNPYTMIVNGYEVKSNYIVAVATLKEYRNRGYMRLLLEKALQDMAERKMPFVFLMPASEKIYLPFDFVWICPHTTLSLRVQQMDADTQNRYLASKYQMFCKRDARYMENLKAEKVAEECEFLQENIPPYMARITDVCQMLRMVYSERAQTIYLKVKDSIIEKNNGYFCWKSSLEFSFAEKLMEIPERVDLELSVGELSSLVFGSFKICLSEFV